MCFTLAAETRLKSRFCLAMTLQDVWAEWGVIMNEALDHDGAESLDEGLCVGAVAIGCGEDELGRRGPFISWSAISVSVSQSLARHRTGQTWSLCLSAMLKLSKVCLGRIRCMAACSRQ